MVSVKSTFVYLMLLSGVFVLGTISTSFNLLTYLHSGKEKTGDLQKLNPRLILCWPRHRRLACDRLEAASLNVCSYHAAALTHTDAHIDTTL